MPRWFRLSLSLTLVFTSLACSHSKHTIKEEASFFGSAKVRRYQLANGLRVLILEDKSAPAFSYQTWFKVGSRDEAKGLTGLAHLFEHMMFKETANHKDGEFDRLLEMAGAEGLNAFTDRDFTAYVQNLPAEKLELIVSLESDRMVNLKVDAEAFTKEREVVKNERRFRNDNNPDGQIYERIFELAYTKHSYHWPVIGYQADLERATARDCESFYKNFYAPNNATIALVGDVDADRAIALIEKYYGKIPSSKINRRSSPAEPTQAQERIQTLPLKVTVEKIMAAYHIPSVNHVEFPAIDVLKSILAGGKSSRLYRQLVDKGIANAVGIINTDRAEPGLFIIVANLQKGKTAVQALDVIDREIKQIKNGRFSQSEIDRAVSLNQFAIYDGLASNEAKAQFMGTYETIAGRFERGIEMVKALRKIDKTAVTKVARTYLVKENRSVVIGTPQGKSP